ncbi:vWA domain-containing protein [Tolumonas auensis]|uniref:vWA domain-containing protein n=1 Tax=Tolumonas auensis TaxID=43948 RepID=UPI002AA87290|nr:tetratricopeptide repeat protein [Tolumonas auensis]
MTDFIFLRPYAFVLLLPLLALFYFSSLKKIKQQSYISAHLLAVLTKSAPKKSKLNMSLLLFIFSCLVITALAGPAIPQKTALAKNDLHTVILLGMDNTMYADDLKPSRLAMTKQKINAYLTKNKTGNTALIAFSGSAHVISPFTDDHGTLTHFIDALNPSVMPEAGSNVVDAMKLAGSLITPLKPDSQIKILLFTDQLTTLQAEKIINYVKPLNWPVDIVFIGTADGSVIPLPEGGLLRTHTGQLIVAKTPLTVLTDTASKLGGKLIDITKLEKSLTDDFAADDSNTLREVIVYKELSYFILFPLILAALLFRRGYILLIPFVIYFPESSYAKDIALDLYKQGQYQQAADTFQDYTWKGNAMYRAGKFSQAIEFYGKDNTPVSHYNRGNALAHTGKIKEAIIAYNQAIQLNPNFQEAKDNKNILEIWLKKQSTEDKDDEVIATLQKKNGNIEKALNFLKALPEESGNLMQKRLQLQQKNKAN